MNFLFPAALALSALGLGIIAVYLQRPRRQALTVSTLQFWQRVLEREPQRQFLGRLRRPLSLLLQLLILAALVLALARPEGSAARVPTVIVLDARSRMQADDGRVFREAVRAAREIAATAGPRHPVAILAVAGGPRIVSGFSGDPRTLQAQLDRLVPTDAAGGWTESLALARSLLDTLPEKGRLVAISDRPADGGEADFLLTGKPGPNAAILTLAQRAIPASPQSAEIFTTLANYSPDARSVELELAVDGRIFDLQSFALAPGATRDYSIIVPAEMLTAGPGHLTARLTAPDLLAADDTARAVLATGRPLRVLLVGLDNPFLESALRADPGIALEMLEPSAWQPALAGGFDVVVFAGEFPESLDLTQGRYLFVGRSPFDAPGEPVRVAEPEITDRASPLFWNVGPTGPLRARLLQAPTDGGWTVRSPLEGDGAPLVLTLEKPGGLRHVAAAFRTDDSAFPLRAGFPIFLSNTVRWLGGRSAETPFPVAAGTVVTPPAGATLAQTPGENPPAFTPGARPLDHRGFYALQAGNDTQWIAVNAGHAAESDLRTATSQVPPHLAGLAPGGLLPWQWIALLALVLLVTEWILHHRRITE